MQIKIPQNPESSISLGSVDTPTQLRIEYNVNSPKTKKADVQAHIPDFITQVSQPVAENELPVVMEQSSCFCSAMCFLGACNFKRARREVGTAEKLPKASEAYSRVEVQKEKRASIVRTNTSEMRSSVQPSTVQLTKVPAVSDGECYIPEIEESSEVDEGDCPVAENGGEVLLVTDDDTSSSHEYQGLLGPKLKKFKGMKCLVLDLDETLVHSSFKPIRDADFIVPVEIERIVYKVYVRKRPFVDEFLAECAKHYEIVIFTASLGKYANPLLDMLDVSKVISHRLFRESCVYHNDSYVKDLSKLGRSMKDIIFVDNSPLSYVFQPYNAIPITSWFNDKNDLELHALLPVLQTTLKEIDDVRTLLDASKPYEWICAQGAQKHINAI